MDPLNVSIIVLMLICLSAIWAWVYIRNRQIGVEVMKVEFEQARLKLGRKQFESQMKIAEQHRAQIMRVGGWAKPDNEHH